MSDREISYDILYMWNLKKTMIQLNLQSKGLTDLGNELMAARDKDGGMG